MSRKNKGHKKLAAPRYVTVFNCDRSCGGSEEGDWYYNCGVAIETIKASTPKQLKRAKALLQSKFLIAADNEYALKNQYDHPDFDYRRQRGSSSVDGDELRIYINRRDVKYFPEEIPHYC